MKGTNRRDGFALPLAVLLLLVTTGAVLASLNQGLVDDRVRRSEAGVMSAAAIAETAIGRFYGDFPGFTGWTWSGGVPVLPADEVGQATVTLDAGRANVTLTRVWRNDSSSPTAAIYLLRAEGVSETTGRMSGAPDAQRVVTRLVRWDQPTPPPPPDFQVFSAWTSLGGLRKNGNAGDLSGHDASPAGSETMSGRPCGGAPSVSGVAVPASPGYSGHTGPVDGADPKILTLGNDSEEAAAQLNIDWEGIVDQTALKPHYIISESGEEGTIRRDDWDDIPWGEYPVVYVEDPHFTFPDKVGAGTIVIPGDATISGSYLWEGVVLVGGSLTSNGNNTVRGAVISGLNAKFGESVGQNDIGNGTKQFLYDSCAVANAMEGVVNNQDDGTKSVRVLDNTWFDEWADWGS